MSSSTEGFVERGQLGQLLGAGVWLVFLGSPISDAVRTDDGWERAVALAAIAVFVGVYLYGLTQVRMIHVCGHHGRAWLIIGALLACTAVTIPVVGDSSLVMLVFVSASACATLPSWWALGVVAALFSGSTATGAWVDGWQAHGNNFAILLASAAVWSFRLAWQRQARLRSAEMELSELAVEEERSRIARDLHDILGHSLTVISVKAELAGRLLDVDPGRARVEVDDLQRLSRDALADVRATTQGIRGISLPGEIASARSALESAGIEPHLPTVADEVPSRWRELYAWTVREGVTNVIRHSGASRCDIEIDDAGVVVRDDGAGASSAGDGTGLDGLRQRARLAGATITTAPCDGGRGFELAVSVPR